LGGPSRVAGGGDADSMLLFWTEREVNGMKCCHKMKRRQRDHLRFWDGEDLK
jgi:hypothetical protein